jgi:hypothetical protein
VTIRSARASAVSVTIRSSRVTNRSALAVTIRCAQAAGPRDDPLRSLLGAVPISTRPGPGRDLSSMSGILADSSYRLLPA